MLTTHSMLFKKYKKKAFLPYHHFFILKGSESFMLRKQAKETLQVALILEKNSIRWAHPLQDANEEGREEIVTTMMMMMMTVMTKLMKMMRTKKIKKTKKERRLRSVKMR